MHSRTIPRIAAIGLLLWPLLLAAQAAAPLEPGVLAGTIVTASGDPAPGTKVTILELKRRTTAASDGAFRFENLPPGTYLLEAVSPRFGTSVERVAVGAATQPLTIRLDLSVHREQVTVSASPDPRALGELAKPVDVVQQPDIEFLVQPQLGDTLATQPGVNQTQFGQGASRPVIRGLSGDRVRMLENGIGVGDVSDTSPDHAVTINTLTTDKFEIVRGPATLLYGSSAIGGVVNSIDGRIPSILPDAVATGVVDLGIGTVANEKRGAVSVDGKLGRFGWHLDGSKLDFGDYEIPGFARVPAEPGDPEGKVPNSFVESEGASGGVSYVADGGYLGVAYSGWDSNYGSPVEEEVTLDMKQRRVDVEGQISTPFAFLRGAKARFGTNDYTHSELEGGEVGTTFNDTGWEGRLELLNKPLGPFTGAFGAQFRHRDLEAIGEERFIPPTKTDSQAVFLFEEAPLGNCFRLQLGGRWEHQDVTTSEGDVLERKFDGYSGSVGLVWLPAPDWSVGVAGAVTTKLPNAQELFSNGPHIGTNAFEIGDPNLDSEIASGLDVSIRRTAGPVSGSLTFFYDSFDGYIYEQPTGEIIDDLQVYRFTQRDARFLGGEGHLDVSLVHSDPHHLTLELAADYVKAYFPNTGGPLPRIPPLRYSGGLKYENGRWTGFIQGWHVDAQDQITAFETPTAGYTFLNAWVGYRLFFGIVANVDLLLRGTNLTDAEARNNVSFIKDFAPLPGRDIVFGIRAAF